MTRIRQVKTTFTAGAVSRAARSRRFARIRAYQIDAQQDTPGRIEDISLINVRK